MSKKYPFRRMNGRQPGRPAAPPLAELTPEQQEFLDKVQRNETVMARVEAMPTYAPIHPATRHYNTVHGTDTVHFPGLNKRDYFMLEIFLMLMRPYAAQPGLIVKDEELRQVIQRSINYSDALIKAQDNVKAQTCEFVAGELFPLDRKESSDHHQTAAVQGPPTESDRQG